jgi:hypothetical protein
MICHSRTQIHSRIATPVARKLSTKSHDTKRCYSWESGKRNLVSHGGTSGEKEWWKSEAHLVKKTNESAQTHIIFLEGLCGTGKADLLWRLSRVRFQSSRSNRLFSDVEIVFRVLISSKIGFHPYHEQMQLSGVPDTFHHFAQEHRSDLADFDRLNTLWADTLLSKVKDLVRFQSSHPQFSFAVRLISLPSLSEGV